MVSHVWHSESFLLNLRQIDVDLYRETTSHMFCKRSMPDPKMSEHNKEQSKGNHWSDTKPQNMRVIKQCQIHEIRSLSEDAERSLGSWIDPCTIPPNNCASFLQYTTQCPFRRPDIHFTGP